MHTLANKLWNIVQSALLVLVVLGLIVGAAFLIFRIEAEAQEKKLRLCSALVQERCDIENSVPCDKCVKFQDSGKF